MPHSEFRSWVAYVQLYGPIDYARRYDYPAALVSWMQGRVTQGSVDDLMPYRCDPVDAPEEGWSEVDQKLLRLSHVA